ncbi:hypothetical protein [Bacillus cereus]|uniref:hypothetical protein n=1 Tax=Bacillus cereus TaxID=1396 RepID=UPI003D979074
MQPNNIVTDGFNEPLFLTKSSQELQIIFSEMEEAELIISNGNETEEELNFIILAFKDWDQYALISNKDYMYTKIGHIQGIFLRLPCRK